MKLFYQLIAVVLAAATTRARAAEPAPKLPAKEKFHLYLLIGQSNMAGRGKIEPEFAVSNERILKFTKENTWALAVEPLHFDKTVAGTGLGMSFARAMFRQCSVNASGSCQQATNPVLSRSYE
jgi:hypothetical protein